MAITVQYAPLFDGGNPRTITGKATEFISGGQHVVTSGNGVVNVSGVNSFSTSDLSVYAGADETDFVGIATQDASSGSNIVLATAGIFVMGAVDTVTAGKAVCSKVDGVQNYNIASAGSQSPIGRALTSASSGGYCIVSLGQA
jgi:hypothetical protein